MIPRRGGLGGYYAATDAKHFDGSRPGSTFTDESVGRLNDVVALAYRQRGDLFGDDRDELVALGAPEEAFKPGSRYLMVRTPGTVGVRRSEGLPGDTAVEVVRSKPGVPCSLVLDVEETPTTDVATIVLGRHPDDESREVVFTAHPGLPIPVDFADRMSEFEGFTVPLSRVREVYGGDVWLSARTVSAAAAPRSVGRVEVFDALGCRRAVTPGVIDDEADWVYKNGQCLALAVAASERTGWPVYLRTFTDGEAADPAGTYTNLRHAYVQAPDGSLVDIGGDHDTDVVEEEAHDLDGDLCCPARVVPAAQARALLAEFEGSLFDQDLDTARSFVDPMLDQAGWGSAVA